MKLSMAKIFIDFDQGLCDQRIIYVHYVHDILSVFMVRGLEDKDSVPIPETGQVKKIIDDFY